MESSERYGSEPIEPTSGRKLRPGQRVARIAAATLAAVLVVVAAGAAWIIVQVRASLPTLDGRAPVTGLTAAVTVERDALGVPTIRGDSRLDVARATGFVHAQDRFFQMDLMRRQAAGEVSEIAGKATVGLDRRIRVHRLRSVALRVVAGAGSEERALLDAYTEGVNTGLAALREKPFEYLALRADPAPWRPEDTVLVLLSMFIELQGTDASFESALGLLHDLLPGPMFAFLAAPGTEWDAPIVGEPFTTPPVPGPTAFDLRQARKAEALPSAQPETDAEPVAEGSNNWAVAGSRTTHGGAILADDMHLGISVPNTWYRASLAWADPARPGEGFRVTGVMLPGTPAVVVGSNARVAWGFTNSYGDWQDLVIVEVDPSDSGFYFAPGGRLRFERAVETIKVKGGEGESLEVTSTIWGPVIDKDHLGRPRALRWTAHDPTALNLNLLRLETARTLEEALDFANTCGIPPQNFVCASSNGRVGWTIAGIIPRRVGFDGRLPGSWRDGTRRWDGWLAPSEAPRVVDPPSGFLWSANARVVAGDALAKIGDGGYALGARARQIRNDLEALGKATERDMLAIQLDDRALFLERWHDLLMRTLTPEAIAADPRRAELKRFAEAWGARASVGSVGYRIVRMFRYFLADQVMTALTSSCREADARFRYQTLTQLEGPVWRLLTERPANLLDPRFKSWDDQLLAAVDATAEYFRKLGGPLAQHTWGERNTVAIRHLLSSSIPGLGQALDMPKDQLPGDSNMPRFQAPSVGASERMAVSPGREAEGLFHMPCGQSGHPLSPFYRAGHEAWVRGEPTPFLPGATVHTLTLVPTGALHPTS
jgi:penicillin amidase